MNLEKFLEFWTSNNKFIIELVFGVNLLVLLYVIYRQFIHEETSPISSNTSANPTQVSLNTTEIEEKLQKIIETQIAFKNSQSVSGTENSENPPLSNASEVKGVEENIELKKQIEQLRIQNKEKDQMISSLQSRASDTHSAPNPASTTGVPTQNSEELNKAKEKIKELEGRLNEYEIISEDIADLSFYKEENSRLQKELDNLKGNSSIQTSSADPTTAFIAKPIEPQEPKTALKTQEPATGAETSKSIEISEITPTTSPSDTPIDTSLSGNGPSTSDSLEAGPIDDDILKEFAAAVEGQKNKTLSNTSTPADSTKADSTKIDNEKLKESEKLMDNFENFLKKDK